MEACADPAVIWLRSEGRALVRKVAAETVGGGARPMFTTAQARLAPYAHRATEIVIDLRARPASQLVRDRPHQRRNRRAREPAPPPVARRGLRAARQLARGLADRDRGPRCAARAPPAATSATTDPWHTRALILERLDDIYRSRRSSPDGARGRAAERFTASTPCCRRTPRTCGRAMAGQRQTAASPTTVGSSRRLDSVTRARRTRR